MWCTIKKLFVRIASQLTRNNSSQPIPFNANIIRNMFQQCFSLFRWHCSVLYIITWGRESLVGLGSLLLYEILGITLTSHNATPSYVYLSSNWTSDGYEKWPTACGFPPKSISKFFPSSRSASMAWSPLPPKSILLRSVFKPRSREV